MRIAFIIIFYFIFEGSSRGQHTSFIPFKNDPAISDKNGVPTDSLALYFPIESFNDTLHYICYTVPKTNKRLHEMFCVSSNERVSKRLGIPINEITDSFSITTAYEIGNYSYQLYKLNEPILYNYRLQQDIYRIKYCGAGFRDMSISIIKKNDETYLTVKELKRPVSFCSYIIDGNDTTQPDNNIPIAINYTKKLTETQFLNFISFIDSIRIYDMPHIKHRGCNFVTHTPEKIFELHTEKGYNYFIKQPLDPENDTPIDQVVTYMIKLSGIAKKEKRKGYRTKWRY